MALKRQRIAELEELDDVQRRIDRVAEDLTSGRHLYGVIDAWDLARLLGVDLDAGGDGDPILFLYRATPEDDVDAIHPLAENIDLLSDQVPRKRYLHLADLAAAIEDEPSAKDIALTEKEEALLRAAYHLDNHGAHGVELTVTTVQSSTGVELTFESTDSGVWSPYDMKRGTGFDPGDLVMDEQSVDLLILTDRKSVV